MNPVEWPIAAQSADRPVEPARRAGGDRLATVRRDFFLDSTQRLSEQERALMTVMLHELVAGLADELRAALPAEAAEKPAESSEREPEAVIAGLSAAGLLDRADLVALLLRRADTDRIASATRPHLDPHRSSLVQSLAGDEDANISSAAMALVLARGRRRDRFGQSLVDFDDLSAESAVAIVHAIGAALRGEINPATADRRMSAACIALLSRHDEGLRLDALVAALVRALDEADRLDDELFAAAAHEGELDLLAAGLARRAGIDGDDAFRYLASPADGRLMMLLRMAGASRSLAARLLADIGELLGIADPGHEIASFDQIEAAAVETTRGWLRLDPHYRLACLALGGSRG
ncbi:MAG TPA: DUF2336 domain-containing protein [Sphingomicrobium sp.]|nr:DUF2336 domain-containing protein [Sphingomicrobium sp.]